MKVLRIAVALSLAAIGVTAAKANGVDPTVVIHKVDPPLFFPVTSPTETFPIVATATNNIFAFQNDTGKVLTSLSLDLFAGLSGLTYSCGEFAGGGVFAMCSSTPGSHHDTLVKFFGVDASDPGIAPATCGGPAGDRDDPDGDSDDACTGGMYTLEFDGIPAGAVVVGTGTVATPEPMTAILLVGGLTGLVSLRKRRIS